MRKGNRPWLVVALFAAVVAVRLVVLAAALAALVAAGALGVPLDHLEHLLDRLFASSLFTSANSL